MTDLRRALRNAVQLLEREAALRRMSIEGGAQEFEEDARLLRLIFGPPAVADTWDVGGLKFIFRVDETIPPGTLKIYAGPRPENQVTITGLET